MEREMSQNRRVVTVSDVYVYEAGINDALADLWRCLFHETRPWRMTAEEMAAKIRSMWLRGEKPWEEE